MPHSAYGLVFISFLSLYNPIRLQLYLFDFSFPFYVVCFLNYSRFLYRFFRLSLISISAYLLGLSFFISFFLSLLVFSWTLRLLRLQALLFSWVHLFAFHVLIRLSTTSRKRVRVTMFGVSLLCQNIHGVF